MGRLTAYHHCTLLIKSNKAILKESLKKPQLNIETKASRSVRSATINLQDFNSEITPENLLVTLANAYVSSNRNYEGEPIKVIDPTESEFPGLAKLTATFRSWDWCFGLTPKFTIKNHFNLGTEQFEVELIIDSGKISDVTVSSTTNIDFECLKGRIFSVDCFEEVYETNKAFTHQTSV